MKTFVQLREELDEVNFSQDHKKNHLSSTKIKNTEVMYHAEKTGSKKVRVFVKPKSQKEFEELGVFKDMATAKKSAEQFVKLMGEDIDEGVSLWKDFRVKADNSIIKETKLDEEKLVFPGLGKGKPNRQVPRNVRLSFSVLAMKIGVKMSIKDVNTVNEIITLTGTKKQLKDFTKEITKDPKDFGLGEEVDYSINEEEIVYKVKGIQKPEMDRFNSAGRMMGLKVSFQKKGSDTMVTMKGTKKKLRDFDAVARGKSSYGDASTVQHFDEK